MGYFQVKYDSRVVNYNLRGFIRLATGHTDRLLRFLKGDILHGYFTKKVHITSY